jgi:hypothetical protein
MQSEFMSSENGTNHESSGEAKPQAAGQAAAEPGLPAVAPPSGRFIAQLFLVPGLIVCVLVVIWLAGNYLVAEKRSSKYFLDNLDSPNEDIRWRAASDLAQVLKRPESIDLASDPKFALELAVRLQEALTDLEQREAELAKEAGKQTDPERFKAQQNKLKPQRKYVLYLISALGGFTVPVGAPLLCQIAEKETGPNAGENALRRYPAILALANLGEGLKIFKKDLKPEKQQQAIEVLKEEQNKPGLRGEWAKAAYQYLAEGKPLGVDEALEQCAHSDDPFVRQLVADTLNFWDGPRVIPTLLQLSKDDGHGKKIELPKED